MKIISSLILFLTIQIGYASVLDTIYISKLNDDVNITNRTLLLKDIHSNLTILDAIRSSEFTVINSNKINKPPGASYWVKFVIYNDLDKVVTRYVGLNSIDIFYVNFYCVDENKNVIRSYFVGNKLKYDSKPLKTYGYSFPINLKPKETVTCFLYLDHKYQLLNTLVNLSNEKKLIKHETSRSFKSGLTIGSITIYLMIALVILLLFKKPIHFNYFIYILGATIFMLSFNEGLRYVWPNFPYFQDPSTFIGPTLLLTGLIGVFRSFFNTKSYNKTIDVLFQCLRLLGVILIIGFLFSDHLKMIYFRLYQIMGVLVVVSFLAFLVVGILIYIKYRRKDHLWFLTSILLMMLTGFLILSVEFGILSNSVTINYMINNLPLLTIYYEATILAFFLIKNIYDEKIASERKVIEERQRIVEGLHDEVISSFGGLKTSFNTFSEENLPHPLKQKFEQFNVSMSSILTKLREVTHAFSSSKKYLDEIIAEIRWYAQDIFESKKIHFDFKFDEDTDETELPLTIKRNLKGFLKEIIYNSVKHAEAKTFKMHIIKENNIIKINLSDDGLGFDLETINTTNTNSGLGLKNIENRAKRMNAKSYTYKTSPDNGVEINLTIDLNTFKKTDYI